MEICHNNIWGTVCDEFWSTLDAEVACRQLGFSSAGQWEPCILLKQKANRITFDLAGQLSYSTVATFQAKLEYIQL